MDVTQQRECRGSLIDGRNPLGHIHGEGDFYHKKNNRVHRLQIIY